MRQDNTLIELSDAAAERMLGLREQADQAVRISAHPDASLAGKYELEFVSRSSRKSEDMHFFVSGVEFLVDACSAELISGTRIDYVEGMWSSGFRFENPDYCRLMSDPLAREVDAVIRDKITPMVAAHRGSVSLVDVKNGRAYVQFGGGCQGCGLAPVTLQEGVAVAICREVPGILGVEDVTDHLSGEEPYYR